MRLEKIQGVQTQLYQNPKKRPPGFSSTNRKSAFSKKLQEAAKTIRENKNKEIDWRKGSASLIMFMCMSLLVVMLLILYMATMNILYANTIVMTRSDAIADSTAVYAQSYDYALNKSQAEKMANLLTTYNNQTSDFYSLATGINFPDDNTMNIRCVVTVPTFYPEMMGADQLYSFTDSTVTSVDIYGDVLQVPEDVSNQWRDPVQNSTVNPGEVDDSIEVPAND